MKRLLYIATASLFLVFASHVQVRANTINVTPSSVDFGNVTIGDTVQSNTLLGQVTLDPTWFVVSWQFEVIGNLTNVGLNGGGGCNIECTFVLTWSPTTVGSISGALGVNVGITNLLSVTTRGFEVAVTGVAVPPVPLPAALPLFATVLAGGGLIAWRRKRKAAKLATS